MKTILTSTALALALAPLAMQGAAAKELVISGYGGLWEQAVRTCFEAPYTALTGNTVAITMGAPNQWINQIKAAPGTPPIDLLMIPSSGAFDAIKSDIVEPIDTARVPNYAEVSQQFKDFTKGMGSVYVYGAMGLMYDSTVVTDAPKTWQEFVDGTIAGKWRASIPGLDYGSSGIASTVWMLAHVSGGDVDNADQGFEDIAKMQESGNLVFWNNANELLNQIGSGEADIGMYWDGRSWAFIDDDHADIRYVNPEPGSVAAMTWVQKVKGGDDSAWDLMNIVLSAEGQACYGNMMRYGMSNANVTYDPAVAPQITRMDSIVIPPFEQIAEKMPEWVDRWNREIH
ncbi:extracellular solute-binding protein [Paroceanicella profunda]|nr:extracellular solute-binding protein [Paroceanicella profunda]